MKTSATLLDYDLSYSYPYAIKEQFQNIISAQPTQTEQTDVNMNAIILPLFASSFDQIDEIRKIARKQKPIPLSIGDGTFLGMFIILNIDVSASVLKANGKPQKINVKLKLKKVA